MPCGCWSGDISAIRSTTFTTRTRSSGDVPAQQPGRRAGLERRHVARAGEDDVRLGALVVAGQRPDRSAPGAVLARLLHVQPLQLWLLLDDDQVHVVAAAQAVVRHARGGSWRPAASRARTTVPRSATSIIVDEAGPLMGGAVVVLAPDVDWSAGRSARRPAPPRLLRALLQPLGVLHEHRVDDLRERLVGGEQPVPARQRVALQPALAAVLAQHLHHPAVRRDVIVDGDRSAAMQAAVRRLEDGVQPVGVGLVRDRTAGSSSGFRREDVAQQHAQPAGPSSVAWPGPGRSALVGPRGKSGSSQVSRRAAVDVRVGAHAPVALGRQRGQLRHQPAAARRTAPPAGSCAASFEHARGARGSRARRRAAPGGRGTCPRPARRPPPSGPVQPLGVRRMIIGQRGRAVNAARSRAVLLDGADLVRSNGPAPRRTPGASRAGSSPSTKCGS